MLVNYIYVLLLSDIGGRPESFKAVLTKLTSGARDADSDRTAFLFSDRGADFINIF